MIHLILLARCQALTCVAYSSTALFVGTGRLSAAEIPKALDHGGYAVAPAGALDVENAPAPLFRCPITDGAADPSVVWLAEEEAWLVYYTARRANLPVQGVGWV
ncbi:MAG: hypothetical protein AAF266_11620, partial [Planctomycetota bacterium]